MSFSQIPAWYLPPIEEENRRAIAERAGKRSVSDVKSSRVNSFTISRHWRKRLSSKRSRTSPSLSPSSWPGELHPSYGFPSWRGLLAPLPESPLGLACRFLRLIRPKLHSISPVVDDGPITQSHGALGEDRGLCEHSHAVGPRHSQESSEGPNWRTLSGKNISQSPQARFKSGRFSNPRDRVTYAFEYMSAMLAHSGPNLLHRPERCKGRQSKGNVIRAFDKLPSHVEVLLVYFPTRCPICASQSSPSSFGCLLPG